MLSKVFLLSFFLTLLLWLSNGDTVPFRARNTETLTIFAFDKSRTDNDGNGIWLYLDYLAKLVSFWDVDKSIIDYKNLPLQIFLGNYNVTSLLNAADVDNNTAALIVLENNDEFMHNYTAESTLNDFSATTKCEQSNLCKYIQNFLNTPRDPLTKLNLVFISNIFPDLSFFKDFYNFGQNNTAFKTTNTYLISTAMAKDSKDHKYLDHQFIPNFSNENYSFKSNTEMLADPRFEFDSKYADSDMFVTINETQYDKAIKSIADYYNNNPLNYIITFKMENIKGLKNSKQIVTVIPKIDYSVASFTVEEYLKQNFDYLLKQNGLFLTGM